MDARWRRDREEVLAERKEDSLESNNLHSSKAVEKKGCTGPDPSVSLISKVKRQYTGSFISNMDHSEGSEHKPSK